MINWQVGDWAIFELSIIQIKKLDPWEEVSDGSFSTSGALKDRLRPLTLTNKFIIEKFDYYYKELDGIRGSKGFNYPDIHSYFSQLALDQIDNPEERLYFQKAIDFVEAARVYTPVIDNVYLFR